ncbi:hypothetical protein [Arthrobacter sp. B10-11]|uniref:hypothetical protein n=1 Tax=Arthrobacter sp. B10-11 TaxID=3081160 RepID=UPI002952F0B6|nr:hypothetical protein [Arthrobacter sp. B10-11]MDV8146262.1 hypothetical protein [Arthrobacter sp. B10-11]
MELSRDDLSPAQHAGYVCTARSYWVDADEDEDDTEPEEPDDEENCDRNGKGGRTMQTSDVIKAIVEMVRSGHYDDGLTFDLHMPDDKDTLKGYVTIAVAIIDVLTSGPRQEEVLNEMLHLGAGIHTTMPGPADTPLPQQGTPALLDMARDTMALSWVVGCVCDETGAHCDAGGCAVCRRLQLATGSDDFLCPKQAAWIIELANKDDEDNEG